jgi:hypothetical protein
LLAAELPVWSKNSNDSEVLRILYAESSQDGGSQSNRADASGAVAQISFALVGFIDRRMSRQFLDRDQHQISYPQIPTIGDTYPKLSDLREIRL